MVTSFRKTVLSPICIPSTCRGYSVVGSSNLGGWFVGLVTSGGSLETVDYFPDLRFVFWA
jgi:hypothetical protein